MGREPVKTALYTPHPHQPTNVNTVHTESLSFNDRVALQVSKRVGTMWFCYGLAILMMAWGVINLTLGGRAFDPYPFSFLFFCLGGIMQSLLMPLLMVAQNLDAHHQEAQSEEMFKMAQKIYQDNETIITQNNHLIALLQRESEDQVVEQILVDLSQAIGQCQTVAQAQQLVWRLASREEMK